MVRPFMTLVRRKIIDLFRLVMVILWPDQIPTSRAEQKMVHEHFEHFMATNRRSSGSVASTGRCTISSPIHVGVRQIGHSALLRLIHSLILDD
jgi:hypothetical protein